MIKIKKSEYCSSILELPIPDEFSNKRWDGFNYLKNEPARDWFIEAMNGEDYSIEVKDLQIYNYPSEFTTSKGKEAIVGIGVACIVRIAIPFLNIVVEETGACSASYPTKEKTFGAFDTCVKGAVSDGFKRCLRYLGPGRELYPDSDFAANPKDKKYIPQLPLMGLTVISELIGLSMADMVAQIAEANGMDTISLGDIPTNKELARDLLEKAKKLYIKEQELMNCSARLIQGEIRTPEVNEDE